MAGADHLLAGLALVLAVAIFTGGFVSARMYYDVGGAPIDVVALRYGVSALVTLPFLLVNTGLLSQSPGLWRAIALALLGGAPFGLLVLTGVAGAPIVHGAGIVPGVALLQGVLISTLLLGERLTARHVIGLATALIGVSVLVWPEISSGEAQWWGDAAYVGAGVLWGSFTVALRAWRVRPLAGATLAAVFSLPYIAVYALALEPQIGNVALLHTIGHGIYQGITFNVLAVMLYGWGISRLGATAGVAAMPLMPVYGAIMEWAILDRIPNQLLAVAIVLITLGVFLTIATATTNAGRQHRPSQPTGC